MQLAGQAIVADGTQVLMPRFDPQALRRVIREQRVTVMHPVPTMYQPMLEKGRPMPDDLALLQLMIWSGAGAHAVVDTVADLLPLLEDFQVRLDGGERPAQA